MSVYISRFYKLTVLAVIVGLLLSNWSIPVAQATASVIPASGGTNINSDSFVNLSQIQISEQNFGEITLGVHTFSLPSGWEFDTTQVAIFSTNSGALSFASDSAFPTANAFSFVINSQSFGAPATVWIENLRVKASEGTSSGILSHSGASITGVTGSTSFANLSLAGSGSVFTSYGGSNYQHTPPTNVALFINNSKESTDSREVTISLQADNVSEFILSNSPDINYADPGFKTYQATTTWTLEPGAGEKTVYAMFKSPQDFYSAIVSDSIILAADGVSVESGTSTEKIVFSPADFNQDGHVNENDLNLILTNWFTSDDLSVYDLTGDQQITIADFNSVLSQWDGSVEAKLAAIKDASLVVTPGVFNVASGDTIKASVALNSNNNSIYTARVVLNYPTNLLDVVSVESGEGFIPLVLGNDNNLIDRTNGVIVRTAGFPGGAPAGSQVMTVTFRAKTSGTGFVSTNVGSVAMNADGHNKFNGFVDSSSLFVFAPNVESSNDVIATPDGQNNGTEVVVTDNTSDNKEATTTPDENNNRLGLLASVGNFLTAPAGLAMEFIILLIALTLGFRWYFSRSTSVITSEEELSKIIAAAAKETEDSDEM